MHKRVLLLAILILAVAGLFGLTRAADSDPGVTRIPIGLAYAGTSVNTTVFRVSSVITAGKNQFVTYYNGDGNIVVAKRDTSSTQWDQVTLPVKAKVTDAHNVVVIGISSDGLLHLSYDHHGNALHYRISEKSYDIHTFGDERAMTGQTEQHVTYPQFVNAPDGTLFFFYRDGGSGNGNLCVNRYDADSHSWKIVAHPLVDGENHRNPYWWRPSFGTDGSLHLAWCWRDTPNAETNHDICYARSNDGGKTWLRSGGKPQAIPITLENAEVVAAIAKDSNLINQCSSAVDADGHPHLAQYFSDDAGVPQFFHIWFDGSTWHRNQVSRRTQKFSLSGSGSLAIPISRPEIAISASGAVNIICRDEEFGGGIRIYRATAPFENWTATDVTHDDLENWEPEYDLSRLRSDGILSLFVLHVSQGNHEKATDLAPQEAALLEMPLK